MAFLNGEKIRDKGFGNRKIYYYLDNEGIVRDNDETYLDGLQIHPGIEYEIYKDKKDL